jgi:hypothetical protein
MGRFGQVEEIDALDEAEYALHDLVDTPKAKFRYEYDFGDGWQHTLLVEKITPLAPKQPAVITCLAGERNGPPEDSGGPWCYPDFLGAYTNP